VANPAVYRAVTIPASPGRRDSSPTSSILLRGIDWAALRGLHKEALVPLASLETFRLAGDGISQT
jgi:hypothetical protein